MPLHEYACETCEKDFEVLVTAKDAEPVRCPECEGAKVRRLFGLPAKGRVMAGAPATNCRGDGPPCGAAMCGRKG
jgi:putative FmdB family regulatory protein